MYQYKKDDNPKEADEPYSIYSEFDVEKHKKTFVNYLEVVIDKSGKVSYAIPSHQEALIRIVCKKHKVTRDELNDMCPPEWYFDFIRWLCMMSGCCSIWDNIVMGYEYTEKQTETLKVLKAHGVYKGTIPETTK